MKLFLLLLKFEAHNTGLQGKLYKYESRLVAVDDAGQVERLIKSMYTDSDESVEIKKMTEIENVDGYRVILEKVSA